MLTPLDFRRLISEKRWCFSCKLCFICYGSTDSIRFAGSDTTSVTVTFTLLLLLNNPGTIEPLIAEIDKAFPSKSDTITFAKTQDLPYLNAVLNESMRCMPIVSAGLARQATEATTLCGYEIPAGVSLSNSIIPVHGWTDCPDPRSSLPIRNDEQLRLLARRKIIPPKTMARSL